MCRKVSFLTLMGILLAIGFYLVFFNQQQTTNPRAEYDKYLHQIFCELNIPDVGPQEKITKAGYPDMAALQNYFMVFDPELKRVPNEKLIKSYDATLKLKQENQAKGLNNSLLWTETGSNMGGRTRAIMWDPNDATGKKAWAGGVTGGLWYNDDVVSPGSLWHPVDDFWPNLTVSCLIHDPNSPMTFYLGTGEYQTAMTTYRESSGIGIGIWKSTDGGETWDIIPSTEEFKFISDMKIRIEGGFSVIYAGVVSGTYHGINHQSEPTDGLYRSSDNGTTWQQVLPNIPGQGVPFAPAHLAISPSGRIFAGTMKNIEGKGGSTILYSDAGTPGSWTIFNDYEAIIQSDPEYYVPGRVIIACAPSDPNRVYALVEAGWLNSAGFNLSRGRYILRSDDAGATWNQTAIPDGNPGWASISWHALIASVNPANPDEVWVGGLDVWKSNNGGNSWSKLSDWALMYYGGGDEYVHADQHIQLYKPGSNTAMLHGTDGGVFYTSNATSNFPVFQEKNTNYSTLQFYTCDIYPVTGQNYFVGGLQDNGTLLYMGEPLDINDMINGGDGAYCFFDKNEPQIMITSYYYNAYTIHLNWSYYNSMGNYGTGVFINPADYDSENNILYANAVTFAGTNPNRILRIPGIPNNPVDQLVNLNLGLNTYFSSVKVSPFSPPGTSTLFLGTLNGRLFKVTNAQSSPVKTEIGSNDFPFAYLSSIAIGGSEDTLLVTFSNYGVPSVWQTYDGGSTWLDISGNLPDMPIRWAVYHPVNAKQVMLATEIGIWTTNHAGSNEVEWVPDSGLPNVRVDMLRVRAADNTVLAATHGRGLMYATWEYDPATGISQIAERRTRIHPNPSNGLITVDLNQTESGSISVYSIPGKLVYSGEVSGLNQIDLLHLNKGTYIVRILIGGNATSEKVILY